MGHLHVITCSHDDVEAGQFRYRTNGLGISSKPIRRLIDQRPASRLLEIEQLTNRILHVVDHQIIKVRQWVGGDPPAVAGFEGPTSKGSFGNLGRFSKACSEVTKN